MNTSNVFALAMASCPPASVGMTPIILTIAIAITSKIINVTRRCRCHDSRSGCREGGGEGIVCEKALSQTQQPSQCRAQCCGVPVFARGLSFSMAGHGEEPNQVPSTESGADRSRPRSRSPRANVVINIEDVDAATPCPTCTACHARIQELEKQIQELRRNLRASEILVHEFMELCEKPERRRDH